MDRERTGEKTAKPNFESNSTTRLLEEIVQAEYLGSRWILALTLASAVESQAKKLADKISISDRLETKHGRDQLIKHIEGWSGGDELKGIAVSAIGIPISDSQEAKHDRDQLIKHIEEWNGGDGLKGIAVSAINRSVEKTTPKILRALRDSGVVTKAQIAAWAASAKLCSPWPLDISILFRRGGHRYFGHGENVSCLDG